MEFLQYNSRQYFDPNTHTLTLGNMTINLLPVEFFYQLKEAITLQKLVRRVCPEDKDIM